MTTETERYREVLRRSQSADRADLLSGRQPFRSPLTDAEIDRMVSRYAPMRKRHIAKASPSPIGPRREDELRYERAIRRGMLAPLMRSLRSGLSQAYAAGMAFEALRGLVWSASMEGLVEEEVAAQAARLDGYHRGRLIQTFRTALGVDIRPVLSDDSIRPLMDAWRRQNVSLIRTIPQRLHDRLYARMSETFAERPFDQQALSRIVSEEGRVADFNLRRVTRDQTSKAIGQLTQARHRQIGIEEYIWRTAGDERVRNTHVALDGSRQRYDSPPSVGNPGSDVMCRCVAIPYIPQAETGESGPRGRRKGRMHYTRRGRLVANPPGEYTRERHIRDREYRNERRLSDGTFTYIAIHGSKIPRADYRELNRRLRDRLPVDEPNQRMLLGVMDDMRPLRSERIVYRTVDFFDERRVGDEIIFPEVLSTSMDRDSALGFGNRTIYQIRVPQGQQATVTNAGEREVILPVGTRVQVTGRYIDEADRIVLIGDMR